MTLATSWAPRLFLSLVALGCGSSDGAGTEPDAGPPPLATISVEFSVLGMQSVVVFSSEPDGTLIDTAYTDEAGRASLRARDGGMVSFSPYDRSLITFLSVNTEDVLLWREETSPLPSASSVDVSVPVYMDDSSYSVYACRDRRFIDEGPASVAVLVEEDCLADSPVPLMAFAYDFRGVSAYASATLDSKSPDAPAVELEWRSDFVETPVTFAFPAFRSTVEASPVLQYGQTFAIVPFADVGDAQSPHLYQPPGDAELLWTDLSAYGTDPGWTEHRGALPEDSSAWLAIPKGLVINHNASATPEMRWIPTGEGDVVRGLYVWDSPSGLGEWQVIATVEDREALYPELPPALEGAFPLSVDPDFAFTYIDIIDYKDLEGVSEVLDSGRMSWGLSSAHVEAFLRGGGSLASATYFDVL